MNLLRNLTAPRFTASLICGALLGFAVQRLLDTSAAVEQSLQLAVHAGLITLAFAFISLNGPLTLRCAALFALGLGLLTGLGLFFAQIPGPSSLLWRDQAPQLLLAWCVLSFGLLPALRAVGAGQGTGYGALWAATFELLVVWIAGLGFMLLSWGVVVLGAEMLDLVGLAASRALFSDELTPFILSGLLFGAASAVLSHWQLARAAEILAQVSRLLAPPFLGVMVLFFIALIGNGLSNDSHTSAALMGWSTVLGALLISTIAGKSGNIDAVNRFWRVVAGGLTLLMLPMAGTALWLAFGSLQQSAATPAMIGDVALAFFAAFLAVGHAVARLRSSAIAGVNRLALGVLACWAVLVLSGLVSPEALAVRDNLARLARKDITLQNMPLRSMSLYWGEAGKTGIKVLQQRFADDPVTLAHIAMMTQTSLPPISPLPAQDVTPVLRQELARKLQVLPPDSAASAAFALWWGSAPETIQGLISACDLRTPAGNPGCLVVAADFLPQAEGDEILLLSLEKGEAESGRASGWQRHGPGGEWHRMTLIADLYLLDVAQTIDHLHKEGVVMQPLAAQALELGDMDIFFRP